MADFTPAEREAIAERRSRGTRREQPELQAAATAAATALAHLDRAVADTVLRDGQRRAARMARHALSLAVGALDLALDAASDPPRRSRV